MKKLIACLGSVLLLAACRKAATEELTVQQESCVEKRFDREPVSLCFETLVQDSRCPANANCVWQGVAQVRFAFTANGQTHRFVLSTNRLLPGSATDTTIQNYSLALLDVQPYPGTSVSNARTAVVRLKRN